MSLGPITNSSFGISNFARIRPNVRSSSVAGGKGLRIQSTASRLNRPSDSLPMIRSIARFGFFLHMLRWLPNTLSLAWERMYSKSHASMGYICTGVAVASNILLVFSDMLSRNLMRLLGLGFSFSLPIPRFFLRALCASSTITHSYSIPSRCSTTPELAVIRP